MKDPKSFAKNYKLRKRAPKGVDPEKHESCVQQVKQQGKDVGSAHAICTSALKKAEHVDKIPGGKADKKNPKDFDKRALAQGIKVEMEHTDDKKVAMEIAMDHLTEDPKYYDKLKQIHTEKSKASDNVACGTGLAGKICRHNRAKLNKSNETDTYQFENAHTAISASKQAAAEATACPELLKYLEAAVFGEISKVRMDTGTLTVYKKEEGLYGGFFQDKDGQTVEQFESVTLPIMAKTLEMKGYYLRPQAKDTPEVQQSPSIEEVVQDVVDEKIDERRKTHIKIKFGNFELEIKKSMSEFINDFKRTKMTNKNDVKKALQAWRRNSNVAKSFPNEVEAAKALLQDWELHSEEFNQILFAMKMRNEK